MNNVLAQSAYDFIAAKDKEFIIAFDEAMRKIGQESGRTIGSGYCWGKYMIIYAKAGVKNKKVTARIYIRDHEIILRLFFNDIDRHREYLENAPEFIKLPFVGDHGNCHRCPSKKDDACHFRKTYTIEGRLIEKCSGVTFEFRQPDTDKLPSYLALLREFYPVRRSNP